MDIDDIHIDKNACLSYLSKLVQFKSYSQTDGELEITQFMADRLGEIGLDTQVPKFDDNKRQNVIATWKGSERTPKNSLLFNGHLDTNPVSEGWTVDPWEGKIDEDFIYGIGVSNMKSGCAAYYCAVEALKRSGWKPRGDVVLTFVVGELQGGVGTMALIDQGHIAKGTAEMFINCEPSDIRAITMHSEALTFEITLVGVTRHMSAREEASDAILAACELIPLMDKMKFSGARSKDHAQCNRCSVGVIHGALGRELVEWRPAQVADVCKLSGSARYAPGQTQDTVMEDIGRVIEGVTSKYAGMTFELKQRHEPTMPAFETDPNTPVVKALNAAYWKVREEAQPTGVIAPTCFYGSDAGHLYARLGMQGVVCGPGGRYNTRPDEKVDIPDYLHCIEIFMRVIVELCG
jgi:acetylornithine deacetylase